MALLVKSFHNGWTNKTAVCPVQLSVVGERRDCFYWRNNGKGRVRWSHCEQTAKCFMPTWFIFTPYATSQWGCVGTLSRHRRLDWRYPVKIEERFVCSSCAFFLCDSLLKIYCWFFIVVVVCFVTFHWFFPLDSEALKSLSFYLIFLVIPSLGFLISRKILLDFKVES